MAIDFTSDHLSLGTNGLTALFAGGATGMTWSFTRSFSAGFPRLFDGYSSNGWYGGTANGNKAYWFEHYFTTRNGWWITPNDTLILNVWQHFAWSWDSDTGTTAPVMYIDGEQVSAVPIDTPLGTVGPNTLEPHFGSASGGGSPHNGKYEDARLYSNRVLSSKEIQTIYHSRGKDGDVVGMQRRVGAEVLPEGTTLVDSSELSPGRTAYTVTNNPFFTVSELAPKY